MKREILFLLMCCLFFASTASGQSVALKLQNDTFQKEILQKTQDFDSIVLIDKTSYWNDKYHISGFGFKGTDIYIIKIFYKFNYDVTDIIFDRINKRKVKDPNKKEAIRQFNYSIMEQLNNDSLNLFGRDGRFIIIRDLSYWSLFTIRTGNCKLTQSYGPVDFQEVFPTKERQLFIDMFNTMEAFLK